MAMSLVRGVTAQDVWDFVIDNMNVEMSAGFLMRDFLLSDHFEAITILDLPVDYTLTAVGAGTGTLYLDELASAIRLASGGVLNDGYTIQTDQTISLARFGLTAGTLCLEFRAKIDNEANIHIGMGVMNLTTNVDRIMIYLDTVGAPPQNDGCIRSTVAGVDFFTDANLVSGQDMTVYHDYRLEIDPGDEIRMYVDDVLVATENDPGEVPEDQTWVIYIQLNTRAAANSFLDVDYYKGWAR